MIRSKKVRDSARGAECCLRLPGICQGGTETTVWAHLNGAAFGKGMGVKAHDIFGFPACHNCHLAYDQNTHGLGDGIYRYLLEAVCAGYLRLVERGTIIVPVDVETPATVKPRKPKSERKPIPKPSNPWPKGRKMQSRKFGQ